ncbi:formate dehydrogenase subunit alpha [bacterium]|nr:formate dehydrogenase subunit alpha [bacterium]
MIELTIDGKTVTVEESATILQAAKSVGIKIPHLCYHKSLLPTSSCRLCVVEVEGARTLVASCSYPVSAGMKVKTATERVLNARRLILDLLLSNHPTDCLTCEKNGVCKLQKYAYELGITTTNFKGEKTQYLIDTSNPFMERDYNKCILCGRCVATCEEQGKNAIDYLHRGFSTKIGTYFDKSLKDTSCAFCGNCVSVCPTGALLEKMALGRGRSWEFQKTVTICPYCGCGCSLVLNTKDNQIIKVTSFEDESVNNGNLCVKGKFGLDFVNHPDRLTSPLIKDKTTGEFKKVSWEEAISIISLKFKDIIEKYGSDSLAGMASAKCTNEENYLFQKFIRAVVGTNNVDNCARLCHAPSVVGLAASFGSGAMTNSISEIKDTDCILIIGSNPTENHPIIGVEIKKAVRNKAKLIVIDPRLIELAEIADLHLKHLPGSDVALINGLLKIIIDEDLYDQEFIETRCEDFDLLKEVVSKYTKDYVKEITGVNGEDLTKAAKIYAQSKKATIIYAMGITQHTTGTDNVLSLANLAMLTGNVGKESTGVNPLRGQNNVQGACDVGALPAFYPGYQRVTDEKIKDKFEKAWQVSLSDKVGLTIPEMLKEASLKNLKAMYIMGENPMISDPDINYVERALNSLEFLVVQDIFLTETARLADVILPGVSFAEKEGTFTNTERRVQRVRQAINPVGSSWLDGKIISQISKAMGYAMDYREAKEIFEEIRQLVPAYVGITYERIDHFGLQWPCKSLNDLGTKYLHKENFVRGKGKFHAVEYLPPYEWPDDEYPFILTTGRIYYHFHTGSMSRRSKGLNEICSEGFIEVSLRVSQDLNLQEDDRVKISSRRGEIITKVKIKEGLLEKVVFMPFHFAESAANILTNHALDPKSKISELKVAAVKIEKYKLL